MSPQENQGTGVSDFARARVITLVAIAAALAWALPAGAAAAEEIPIASRPGRGNRHNAAEEVLIASSLPALIVALRDPKPETRAEARAALVKAGPKAVPALVTAIKGDGSREFITKILIEIGSKAVPELIILLKSPELRNRAGAALFRVIGPRSLGQTPALLDCLHDPAVNNYCGTSLVKIMGPKAKSQVPRLLEALRDSDPTVRIYVVAALGRTGAKGKKVNEALEAAARDENAEVRRLAQEALSNG